MQYKSIGATTVITAALFTCLVSARDFNKRPAAPDLPPAASEDGMSVYFSPAGGCEAAIVSELGSAKRSIDMQAYTFTSTEIAKALADAHERGVKVRAILDKAANEEHYSGATYLFNHKVPTWVDGEHPIAHNKVLIVDGQTVLTGSFNFSKQTELSNAENLLIVKGKPKIAQAYAKNFEEHLGHAKTYEGVKTPAGDGRKQ